MYTVIKTMFIV